MISSFVFSQSGRARGIYMAKSQKKGEKQKREHPGNGQTQREIRAGEGAKSNAQMIGECRGAI